MKTILVPIDGSDNSERAMLKAKELAESLGSKIILLNITNVVPTAPYYPNAGFAQTAVALDWPGLLKAAREKSEQLLQKSKELLGSLDVETVILDDPSGRFANVIVDYAEERNADLIVMGSKGMGSLRHRLYLGSVTTKVLHTTEKIVMVVQ